MQFIDKNIQTNILVIIDINQVMAFDDNFVWIVKNLLMNLKYFNKLIVSGCPIMCLSVINTNRLVIVIIIFFSDST